MCIRTQPQEHHKKTLPEELAGFSKKKMIYAHLEDPSRMIQFYKSLCSLHSLLPYRLVGLQSTSSSKSCDCGFITTLAYL